MDLRIIEIWTLPCMLWAVGLLAWVMTYILVPMKVKKTGKNVSGIPGVPFVLFLIAGLLSPYKLLALLCLIDISVFGLVYEIFGLLISGDLKYDWGKIYVWKMKVLGYDDFDDSVKQIFDTYYKECKRNKTYKTAAKEYRYDFKKYCRIVAGLRTSKHMDCKKGDAYSVVALWGMSDFEFNILKVILPEDVRDLAIETYLTEKEDGQIR